MEYKFQKKHVSNSTFHLIECKEKHLLENFSIYNWTPALAQAIIDGVEGSKTKSFAESYSWGNEDIILKSMEHGVFLWDMMARRADKNHKEEQDLQLTHQEFIDFMKDFKKFIEENS